MSKFEKNAIFCPKCGKKISFVTYDSINVTKNPELKAKTIDTSLFSISCKKCGYSKMLEYVCLYHDMAKKYIIFATQNMNIEEAANYLKFFANQNYKIRLVPSIRKLVEKVKIFEFGLKDTAIEYFKIDIIEELDNPNLINNIYFENISKENGKRVINYLIDYNDQTKRAYIDLEQFLNFQNILPENLYDNKDSKGMIVHKDTLLQWLVENKDNIILENESNKNIQLFDNLFQDLKNLLTPYSLLDNLEFEIMAFIYFTTDLALFQYKKERREVAFAIKKHLKERYGISRSESEYIDNRVDFYGEIARGKNVQGLWWLGDETAINNQNVVFRCLVALGDIVRNPDLLNNYEKGGIVIGDITDTMAFSQIMIHEVLPKVNDYIINHK